MYIIETKKIPENLVIVHTPDHPILLKFSSYIVSNNFKMTLHVLSANENSFRSIYELNSRSDVKEGACNGSMYVCRVVSISYL